MVLLNKCCCCCQLRTGVVVLGWLGVVAGILNVTIAGVAYANRDTLLEKMTPEVATILNFYLPIRIAEAVISLLTYIMMVWGATAGNRFLLLPWLIMQMIMLVVFGLAVLGGGIALLASGMENAAVAAGLVFGIGIPCFALGLYIWLCVLSCFQELRDSGTVEQNVLLELPKTLENVITDYRPPEYERLEHYPKGE